MINQEFIEDNILIISKQTIDEFLKEENPGELMALYIFYYYTAKWQKTNQPKCVDKYVKKGLYWGIDRLKKAQKKLIELDLIELIKRRDAKGKITGWYIKLNYLWKKETIKKQQLNQNTQNTHLDKTVKNDQNTQKPEVDTSTCGKQDTNTLSDNNTNALSASSLNIYNHWISKNSIPTHKKLTEDMKSAIKTRLKEHSEDDLIKAIDNYDYVLGDNNSWFTYTWGIEEFMKRGFKKFLEECTPRNNFKRGKPKQKEIKTKADFGYEQ